ncbi:6,7-dimethyl-8-ribityllumazine synthase [Candidatus Endolissoclinum faulkneri L5]|uniref:6,7-dimethyl-8-ribityllumazine synthase n=1 Tax=Candidatus Endolissoclinum faulkneri L5 TaxID=1401328 RepID=V9TT06_9PROT|nr:6,7-dimethyl-8-ribityllumazine synthase [Candidatus Endolissoclinum faulkneri]AHC73701.1 6,7-dimethyl-8-ribityllumazine synthase [Candidatus Endolissoclinum faulkneri L5]
MHRILIVKAGFYEEIVNELLRGAVQHLQMIGVKYDQITVPGAFEIPGAISMAFQSSLKGGVSYDGYLPLGCVIRGETNHYDYICSESARGIMQLSLRNNLVIVYGILTVENAQQAWERAKIENGKNKGKEFAEACMKMISLRCRFSIT